MKKLVPLFSVALLLPLAHSLAWAGFGNGVSGSPHDFSLETWNDRKEVCRVCHVPHDHQRTLYQNGLLWNHAVSAANYTLYESSTMNVPVIQPEGSSKLCLGCHDGLVAVSAFDSHYATGGAEPLFIDDYNSNLRIPGANNDMRGTHPVSIPFPDAADDPNFLDPTTQTWIGGITVSSTLQNGMIQCATCHDVHDQVAIPGTRLLRAPQTLAQGATTPSQLCLTCHIK